MKRRQKGRQHHHNRGKHKHILHGCLAPAGAEAGYKRFIPKQARYSSSSSGMVEPSDEINPFSMAFTTASVRLLTPNL